MLTSSDNGARVDASNISPPATEVTPGVISTTVTVELPPDGGYAWVVLGGMALINCFTWGLAASYGVYIAEYLAKDYFPGATPLDFALIGGMEFGVAFLIAPICTVATRELGRRIVMSVGIVTIAGGYIAASFVNRIWQLYLTQGVMIGLGVGAIFIPSIQVLPQWFLKRRSLAGGLTSGAAGLGGVAFSLGTNAMIEHISLSWAYRITGILCFAGNLSGALLIRDRNHLVKPPQLGFAVHLLRRYDCLLLLAWAFINVMGYMAVLYSLSNYAVQVAGLPQSKASLLTAIINLGTAFGRPAIGMISDRCGRVETAAVTTFACAFFVFVVWIPAGTKYGAVVFFALAIGSILGVYWQSVGPLCAEVAGLAEVPSFLSLQWLTVVLPTTFAEVIALYLRRPGRGRWGYLYPQLFAGLSYLVASMCLFELWRVRSRQKRNEQAQAVEEEQESQSTAELKVGT